MDNIIFSKIDETNIEGCFNLNQDNVPEVGSTSIEEFDNLVQNSDFSLCATFDEKIVGFLICFQDTSKTKSFMYKIKHKNFNEFKNRINNFMYIDRIAIDVDYRNNGLATIFYENLLEHCLEVDVENITAEINLLPTENEPSLKFHEKLQFIQIDTKKYNDEYEFSLQKRIL